MIILIDNGHGSNTIGKASPVLDESLVIDDAFTYNKKLREWKYTRIISTDVVDSLKAYGYDARLLVPEATDISLSERVRRVNTLCNKVGKNNVILLSVHANAKGNGASWESGSGWEAWTTVGQTESDVLAECLYKRAEKNFKGRKIRKDVADGDSDKEENFYILRKTLCPAVLTENFFYDNLSDIRYMSSDEGVHGVVRTHVEGIIDYLQHR